MSAAVTIAALPTAALALLVLLRTRPRRPSRRRPDRRPLARPHDPDLRRRRDRGRAPRRCRPGARRRRGRADPRARRDPARRRDPVFVGGLVDDLARPAAAREARRAVRRRRRSRSRAASRVRDRRHRPGSRCRSRSSGSSASRTRSTCSTTWTASPRRSPRSPAVYFAIDAATVHDSSDLVLVLALVARLRLRSASCPSTCGRAAARSSSWATRAARCSASRSPRSGSPSSWTVAGHDRGDAAAAAARARGADPRHGARHAAAGSRAAAGQRRAAATTRRTGSSTTASRRRGRSRCWPSIAVALGATSVAYDIVNDAAHGRRRARHLRAARPVRELPQRARGAARSGRRRASRRSCARSSSRGASSRCSSTSCSCAASFLAAYVLVVGGLGNERAARRLPRLAAGRARAALRRFVVVGIYRRVWRYAGAHDVVAVAVAVRPCRSSARSRSSASSRGKLRSFPESGLPPGRASSRTVLVRRRARRRRQAVAAPRRGRRPSRRRVLVVGAGRTGRSLARELRETPGARVVGFVDDNPARRAAARRTASSCRARSTRRSTAIATDDAGRGGGDDPGRAAPSGSTLVVGACEDAGVPCRFVRRRRRGWRAAAARGAAQVSAPPTGYPAPRRSRCRSRPALSRCSPRCTSGRRRARRRRRSSRTSSSSRRSRASIADTGRPAFRGGSDAGFAEPVRVPRGARVVARLGRGQAYEAIKTLGALAMTAVIFPAYGLARLVASRAGRAARRGAAAARARALVRADARRGAARVPVATLALLAVCAAARGADPGPRSPPRRPRRCSARREDAARRSCSRYSAAWRSRSSGAASAARVAARRGRAATGSGRRARARRRARRAGDRRRRSTSWYVATTLLQGPHARLRALVGRRARDRARRPAARGRAGALVARPGTPVDGAERAFVLVSAAAFARLRRLHRSQGRVPSTVFSSARSRSGTSSTSRRSSSRGRPGSRARRPRAWAVAAAGAFTVWLLVDTPFVARVPELRGARVRDRWRSRTASSAGTARGSRTCSVAIVAWSPSPCSRWCCARAGARLPARRRRPARRRACSRGRRRPRSTRDAARATLADRIYDEPPQAARLARPARAATARGRSRAADCATSNRLWSLEFWNRSLKAMWSLDRSAPGPGNVVTADLGATDGTLSPRPEADCGRRERRASRSRTPPPSHEPSATYTVQRLHGPIRLASAVHGVSNDGWMGERCRLRPLRRRTPAPAASRASRVRTGWCGPGRARQASRSGSARSRSRAPAADAGRASPPAACTRRSTRCEELPFLLPAPAGPWRAEVEVTPTLLARSSSTRRSADARQLGAQVSFGYQRFVAATQRAQALRVLAHEARPSRAGARACAASGSAGRSPRVVVAHDRGRHVPALPAGLRRPVAEVDVLAVVAEARRRSRRARRASRGAGAGTRRASSRPAPARRRPLVEVVVRALALERREEQAERRAADDRARRRSGSGGAHGCQRPSG